MYTDKELLIKIREEINNKFCVVDELKKEFNKIGHVLIIDDDDISNYTTRKTLQCYNLADKITVYDNPIEALNDLKNNIIIPDIILLDIQMPLMDGFEFIEEFKTIKTKSTIFLLTSSSYQLDKERAKNFGISYMTKPLKFKNFQKYL
jgi:CheY-like chemotaxis protein